MVNSCNIRLVCAGLLAVCSLAAYAQPDLPEPIGRPASVTPELIKKIGLDQKLNAQIPLELRFTDETNQSVRLGQYFTTKPVVLALVYYDCPMLCDMVLNEMVHAMGYISLKPGKDFEIVTVSFNPKETYKLAASKKANYIEKLGQPEAAPGWHFLTGKLPEIQQLTSAVGFRYAYDPATDQYAHPSGIMVATPEGKISRYYYGISYPPRDVRFGLIEASNHKIGGPVDKMLLYCFHYDPATGKYGFIIQNLIRVMGSLTVVALAVLIFYLTRKGSRRPTPQEAFRSA